MRYKNFLKILFVIWVGSIFMFEVYAEPIQCLFSANTPPEIPAGDISAVDERDDGTTVTYVDFDSETHIDTVTDNGDGTYTIKKRCPYSFPKCGPAGFCVECLDNNDCGDFYRCDEYNFCIPATPVVDCPQEDIFEWMYPEDEPIGDCCGRFATFCGDVAEENILAVRYEPTYEDVCSSILGPDSFCATLGRLSEDIRGGPDCRCHAMYCVGGDPECYLVNPYLGEIVTKETAQGIVKEGQCEPTNEGYSLDLSCKWVPLASMACDYGACVGQDVGSDCMEGSQEGVCVDDNPPEWQEGDPITCRCESFPGPTPPPPELEVCDSKKNNKKDPCEADYELVCDGDIGPTGAMTSVTGMAGKGNCKCNSVCTNHKPNLENKQGMLDPWLKVYLRYGNKFKITPKKDENLVADYLNVKDLRVAKLNDIHSLRTGFVGWTELEETPVSDLKCRIYHDVNRIGKFYNCNGYVFKPDYDDFGMSEKDKYELPKETKTLRLEVKDDGKHYYTNKKGYFTGMRSPPNDDLSETKRIDDIAALICPPIGSHSLIDSFALRVTKKALIGKTKEDISGRIRTALSIVGINTKELIDGFAEIDIKLIPIADVMFNPLKKECGSPTFKVQLDINGNGLGMSFLKKALPLINSGVPLLLDSYPLDKMIGLNKANLNHIFPQIQGVDPENIKKIHFIYEIEVKPKEGSSKMEVSGKGILCKYWLDEDYAKPNNLPVKGTCLSKAMATPNNFVKNTVLNGVKKILESIGIEGSSYSTNFPSLGIGINFNGNPDVAEIKKRIEFAINLNKCCKETKKADETLIYHDYQIGSFFFLRDPTNFSMEGVGYHVSVDGEYDFKRIIFKNITNENPEIYRFDDNEIFGLYDLEILKNNFSSGADITTVSLGNFSITISEYPVNITVTKYKIKNIPSCFDGIMNGDEEGIDCGGSCIDYSINQTDEICGYDSNKNCVVNPCEPSCNDDSDCGDCSYPYPNLRMKGFCNLSTLRCDCTIYCGDGYCSFDEYYNEDCLADCDFPEHCLNSIKDGDEEGIDCGGSCPSNICLKPLTPPLLKFSEYVNIWVNSKETLNLFEII